MADPTTSLNLDQQAPSRNSVDSLDDLGNNGENQKDSGFEGREAMEISRQFAE
jgi:hypothetical protein